MPQSIRHLVDEIGERRRPILRHCYVLRTLGFGSNLYEPVPTRAYLDSVQFGAVQTEILSYAVEISPQCSEVRASYSKGMIQATIPVNLARVLASTNQVGIEHVQSIAKTVALKIVLEQDFQCFHPRPGEK
jgi:hypothetical protein